jgi:hypothetical protein
MTVVTTAAMLMVIVVAATTMTATVVGGEDNGSNSNGMGHRHQSTKSGSEGTVAVATGTETAAADAATTAAGASTTALGIGADGIPFATIVGAATPAASTERTAWCFGRGLAHIVQYLFPLLEVAHAPHSQSEVEEEETMMGGLCMLVVRVVCSGCVCAVTCCFVRLTRIRVHQKTGKPRHIGDRRKALDETN